MTVTIGEEVEEPQALENSSSLNGHVCHMALKLDTTLEHLTTSVLLASNRKTLCSDSNVMEFLFLPNMVVSSLQLL